MKVRGYAGSPLKRHLSIRRFPWGYSLLGQMRNLKDFTKIRGI
jgi:hypothetical protein